MFCNFRTCLFKVICLPVIQHLVSRGSACGYIHPHSCIQKQKLWLCIAKQDRIQLHRCSQFRIIRNDILQIIVSQRIASALQQRNRSRNRTIVTDADFLRCRIIQTHSRVICNDDVLSRSVVSVVRNTRSTALLLVIVAEVQQAAFFHIDRALLANLVVLNDQIVQNQMTAIFHNDQRNPGRSTSQIAVAVEDQRLAAFDIQRCARCYGACDRDIRDVRVQAARPLVVNQFNCLARLTGRLHGGIIRRKRSRNESAGDEGYYHGQH